MRCGCPWTSPGYSGESPARSPGPTDRQTAHPSAVPVCPDRRDHLARPRDGHSPERRPAESAAPCTHHHRFILREHSGAGGPIPLFDSHKGHRPHGSVQQACDRFRRMLPEVRLSRFSAALPEYESHTAWSSNPAASARWEPSPNFIVWLTVKAFQVVDCFQIGLEETVEKLRPFFRREMPDLRIRPDGAFLRSRSAERMFAFGAVSALLTTH